MNIQRVYMLIQSVKPVHEGISLHCKTSYSPDFGGLNTGRWFGDAENISGAPKHNLLCSLEHKFPGTGNYYAFPSF